MFRIDSRLLGCLVAAAPLILAPAALAGDAEDVFHEAYYLEHAEGDLEAAVQLYASVAADTSASEELRERAKACARGCAEEIAASDFARLCPEDTIFYAELNRPAEQLGRFLGQLGLLQGSEGSGAIAVSPRLVEGLLGCRGAAIAVTHVDPTGGPPNGVAVLHPGDLDVIRGLIETALPAGGQPSKPVAGHPTWNIENQVYVTTTERLVVASPDRNLIQGVIERMYGQREDSLAGNEDLAETMAMRGEDLLFFCLNAEPVMPAIQALLASQVGDDPQAAMALALLDLDSTRAIAGRVGVDGQGISMDLGLQLAEEHRNLAFNLLRMPHLAERSFELVPEGAAFFLASTLNPAGGTAGGLKTAGGEPVVTLMDFGREVFGNVVDVAVYGLPSTSPGPFGQPLPDVALALTVNDPDRSKALWGLVLGLAKGATGSGQVEPQQVRIGGADVERFEISGVGVYVYTHEKRMVLSASERAIEAAVTSAKNGRSIRDDDLYAGLLTGFSGDETTAFAVSAGRAAQIARSYMGEGEMAAIAQYLPLLERAVLAAHVRHSDTRLAVSARLGGLPKVGGMFSEMIQQHLHGSRSWARREIAQVTSEPAEAPVPAIAVAPPPPEPEVEPQVEPEAEPAARPAAVEAPRVEASADVVKALRARFEELVQAGETETAGHVAGALYGHYEDDPFDLNNFAWALLTEERYANAFDGIALKMALRSNELSEYQNWYYLDTLGHAYFHTGDFDKAVTLQAKAVEVAGSDPRAGEARAALLRFRAAKVAKEGGGSL